MKTLCIYYSRTDTTKKLTEGIAAAIGAETASISDGKSYEGTFGFMKAAFRSMSKKAIKVPAPETKLPLSEYDQVIIAAPIWAENWCCVAKGFLAYHGKKLPKKVSFVFTHMGDKSYENVADDMEKYLPAPKTAFLSVSTKEGGYEDELKDFIEKISR